MVLEKTLASLWDSKEIKQINPKGSQPWIFIRRTDAKLQHFGHLMERADLLAKILTLGKFEGKRRRGWQRIKWLGGITDSMDMSFSKLWEIVKDREAWHVHGVTNSRTRLGNWTVLVKFHSRCCTSYEFGQYIVIYIYNYNIIQYFHYPKNLLYSAYSSFCPQANLL